MDDYIVSATPISSKDLQEKHLKECSSATIRNELSTLESMGYLLQPHTSAGRVPSHKAFRFYVDQLMEHAPLDNQEIEVIKEHFNKRLTNIQDIMQSTAKLLAKITHYPSVAVGEVSDSEVLKNILLARISSTQALVLIVTNVNVFKDGHIAIGEDITDQSLAEAGAWLNRLFANKTIEELKKLKANIFAMHEQVQQFRKLFDDVIELLIRVSERKRAIFTEGGVQMLEYPEYNDIVKAKRFLTAIEDKEGLAELIEDNDLEMSIKIGREEDENVPDGCALITAKFTVKDIGVGSAAVIGPVRMNYKKVVSVMDYIAKLVNEILEEKTD